jgi:hypothetical protein
VLSIQCIQISGNNNIRVLVERLLKCVYTRQYLVVLWIQLHTLHAVCVCIAVHLQLEAGHGTVGSNQRHLLLHVVLAAVVQSLEVLAQSFGVLALLKEVVTLFL